MIYFISGHRDLNKEDFEKHYVPMINAVLEDRSGRLNVFVVGDCDGVDKMAQDYLSKTLPKNLHIIVTVYHPGNKPRYLASPCFLTSGGYKDDVEKDEAMTRESQVDLAVIQKGRWTSGTAQNILRRYERDM